MLHSIHYDDIVRFEAFCQTEMPRAIMLEYLHFNFSVFINDCDKVVCCLREFSNFVDTVEVLETLN